MAVNDNDSPQGIFTDSHHAASHRFAIFEDDGTSAWLYLTEPNTQKPTAAAWVYNRIAAPPAKDIQTYRGGSPPAAIGYASVTALCQSPHTHKWKIIWADDGNSVAITKDGNPVACIISVPKASYSRELIKDGPWGHMWSDYEFNRVF
ncbi:MAG: hypothetical protein AAF215_33210 [Cyanobacteria bacterium P01_A01_bin.123]